MDKSARHDLHAALHGLLDELFKESTTFLSRMTFFIMAVPMPPMFILESLSLFDAARHHAAEHSLHHGLFDILLLGFTQ
jgi:hypothetical protein